MRDSIEHDSILLVKWFMVSVWSKRWHEQISTAGKSISMNRNFAFFMQRKCAKMAFFRLKGQHNFFYGCSLTNGCCVFVQSTFNTHLTFGNDWILICCCLFTGYRNKMTIIFSFFNHGTSTICSIKSCRIEWISRNEWKKFGAHIKINHTFISCECSSMRDTNNKYCHFGHKRIGSPIKRLITFFCLLFALLLPFSAKKCSMQQITRWFLIYVTRLKSQFVS